MSDKPMNDNVSDNSMTNRDAVGDRSAAVPLGGGASPYPYARNSGTYPAAQGGDGSPRAALRAPFSVSRRDYGFAAGLIALCVAVVFMGMFCGFGLGFTVSGLGLFAALSAYLRRPGEKPGVFACVCGGLAAATFSVFALCTDERIKLFACAAVIGLSAVWFDALTGRTEEKGDFGLVYNLINHVAGNTFSRFGQTWRGLLFSGQRKTFGKALIGVLCAAPVAAAAVALLVKAESCWDCWRGCSSSPTPWGCIKPNRKRRRTPPRDGWT